MKENTDLANQLDAMVSQCQRMNAGKLRISFKRKNGNIKKTFTWHPRLFFMRVGSNYLGV